MKREKTDWPGVMINRLTRLHADPQRSFKAIAEQLSREFGVMITKNACIGKARRLGLEQRAKGTPAPKPRKKRPLTTPHLVPSPEVVPPVLPGWTVEPPVLPAASGRIAIYQLRRGVCHFPFGNRPPYAYCGGTTATRTSPWCPHHERVVYPRGPGR